MRVVRETDRQTKAATLQAFGVFSKTHLRGESNYDSYYLAQIERGKR